MTGRTCAIIVFQTVKQQLHESLTLSKIRFFKRDRLQFAIAQQSRAMLSRR